MAVDKLTLIAELKDRLTGPAKKAAKSLEDLGKASEKSAKRSVKASAEAERAEMKRARASERTARIAADAAARRAKWQGVEAVAAEKATRRVVDAETRAVESSKRNARESERAHRSAADSRERAARRTIDANERVNKSHGRSQRLYVDAQGRLRNESGRFATAAEKSAWRMQQAFKTGMNPSASVAVLRRGMDTAVSIANRGATKINSAMGKAAKSMTTGMGGLGVAAVGAGSLAGGMSRISGLQNTDVALETMGYDENARKELSAQFQERALGTRYSTPDVAGLGASLLSSGLERDKLDTALSGAVDAASVYNLDLNDIAIPLQQVQTKGKLYAEEMMQLQEKRMDISGWLAEYKGVDRAKISAMVTKGQITPDDVFEAIAQATEGGAERAGKTISGSWANFKNAFSMGGAEFLKPMVEPLTNGMNDLRKMMGSEGVTNLLGDLGGRLAPGITGAVERVPALVEALRPLEPTLKNLFSAAGSALPGIISGFTNWISVITPIAAPLLDITSLIVRGLAPMLPVIVPGLMAFAAGITAIRVASTAATALGRMRRETGLLSRALLGKRGAAFAAEMFSRDVSGTRGHVTSLAGAAGFGKLDTSLDRNTKKFGKADRAAKGFKRTLGGLAGMSLGALGGAFGGGPMGGGAGGGIVPMGGGGGSEGTKTGKGGKFGDIARGAGSLAAGLLGGPLGVGFLAGTGTGALLNSLTPAAGMNADAFSAAIQSGDMDAISKQMHDAKWANGNDGLWGYLNNGMLSGINNAGDAAAYLAAPGFGRKAMEGVNSLFGHDTAMSKAREDFATWDSALASMVQSGDTAKSGAQFNSLVAQAEAAGSNQQDMLKLFPEYKSAVQGRLMTKGQASDDAAVLAAMRSERGFRGGGYTGNGGVNEIAGAVHGREFVFDAAATARIGPTNLEAARRGQQPPTSSNTVHFSPTINISGATGADTAKIRSTVQAVLREEARKMRNTHGTRRLAGAK